MEELKITGSFFLLSDVMILDDVPCTLFLDFLNFSDSIIRFNDIVTSSKVQSVFLKNDIVVFKNSTFYMILKSKSLEFMSVFNAIFHINKLTVLNDFSDEITYESSRIKSLRVPNGYCIETKDFKIKPIYHGQYYYWRITSNILINIEEIDYIFRILSSITASFFTFRMITNDKMQKEYHRKTCRSSRFFEIDHLIETFSIDFYRLYYIKENRNVISSLLAEYTFSITCKDIEYRLFKCMNLLDYIIELSSRRETNQSVRLIKILNKILTEQEKKHILKLIPYYNEINKGGNNTKPRNFDFYDYRNSSYHRGFQLINDEDIDILLYCLHIVNEVLRILISNFDKINFKNKKFVLNIGLTPTVSEIKMITKELNNDRIQN